MSIIDTYNRERQTKNFQKDPEQQKAVQHLAQLQHQLALYHKQQSTLSYKVRAFFNMQPAAPCGCYIWGDVGRGKTWLMDLFYDSLGDYPEDGRKKVRLHFHHFMQVIHDQLSLLGQQKKPLTHIAKVFARHYQVLCLDEFHVSDITDAMLLYGLLETLLEEGVVLVATSNQKPEDLYKNGLQRERFLPAIDIIKDHCDILQLDGNTDHRLRLLEKADTWHLDTEIAQSTLEQRFLELATSPAQRHYRIHINYRLIECVLYTSDIVWIDFMVICGDRRGSADYIEIARLFHTVFISHIPIMNDGHNDKTKRFINMIDEFYDRNVNLLVIAEAMPEHIYTGQQLAFEFKRTVSRLQEMRSHEFMQRAHKIS